MNQDPPSPAPMLPRELQLRAARAAIAAELGADRLAELHKGHPLLDGIAIIGAPVLFLLCAHVLGAYNVRDPLWWFCLVVQGDLVLVLAFINHDAFVHRKLLSPPLRWILSSILVWPSQLRAATYERQHLTHHRALGTGNDTELYKQGIDTAWKRILYATPGALLYRAFVLKGKTSSVSIEAGSATVGIDRVRAKYERFTRWVLLVMVAAVAAWNWRYVVYGYLLPFATVTPLLNTMRIVLEHFDLDRRNPLWVGTFYRTGPISRLMFWWDAGDCHLIHHFYANIPYHRMGRALALMRPILLREGVFEQTSMPRLLWDWFSGRRAHWSVPPHLRKTP